MSSRFAVAGVLLALALQLLGGQGADKAKAKRVDALGDRPGGVAGAKLTREAASARVRLKTGSGER
jgi:hypothetical protein